MSGGGDECPTFSWDRNRQSDRQTQTDRAVLVWLYKLRKAKALITERANGEGNAISTIHASVCSQSNPWLSKQLQFDALLRLSGTHYRKLSLIVTVLLCSSLGQAKDIPLLPGFLSSLFSVAHCLAPAPLKLRPNTFIIIIFIPQVVKTPGVKNYKS